MGAEIASKQKALQVARCKLMHLFNSKPGSTKAAKSGSKPTKPAKHAKKKRRLIDDMITVMRAVGKPMSGSEVFAELKKRGWVPVASDDPPGYVLYTLSANKHLFPRTETRGVYKVTKAKTLPKKPPPKQKKAPTKKPEAGDGKVVSLKVVSDTKVA